jgi:NitT/TauT family transport system substrate-binding protein
MRITQTRRRFLTTVSLTGVAGLLGARPAPSAEAPLETTAVRLPKIESVCVAPQDVVADLLRAEGFTDIRHFRCRRAPTLRTRSRAACSILA